MPRRGTDEQSHGCSSREFLSTDTGIDRSDRAVTVGFARNLQDENAEDAFVLQRSLDSQEDNPGVVGIYVEVPPQKYATYGGIAEAVLYRDSFDLRLTPEAARQMGGICRFLAHFEIGAKSYEELQDALRFVFAGCACYREIPSSRA